MKIVFTGGGTGGHVFPLVAIIRELRRMTLATDIDLFYIGPKDELKASTMKSGIEYMVWLSEWYRNNSSGKGVGFFQIGGGIAGDFPICVVPMLYQDMEMEDIPFWSYFCQISDSTTSYGSYSGAVPNEKITWGKLDIETPKFIVESDATIVAPLIFAWLLRM